MVAYSPEYYSVLFFQVVQDTMPDPHPRWASFFMLAADETINLKPQPPLPPENTFPICLCFQWTVVLVKIIYY